MIEEGRPEPLGVTPDAEGVNVAVWSAHAEAIEFCLFDAAGEAEVARLRLPGRTGAVFHGRIAGVGAGARYGLRAHGPWRPQEGQRFNPAKLLVDPWASAIDRPFRLHPDLFDAPDAPAPNPADTAALVPKGIVLAPPAPLVPPAPFAWDRQVIYEINVRGFTMRHPDIAPAVRGTFAALAHPAALAHLRRLGVTAVELMPSAAWVDERHLPPLGLTDAWGYNPVAFLAPDPRLAPGGWAEVRAAVAALQQAGIAVVIDAVLNHSGEGDHFGPTLSLRGLDHATWYRLAPDDPGRCIDDTGCGNTMALDRPVVVRLAMDALRTWAARGGVDGFRFDLATTLGRRADGFDAAAPLLTAIAQDPLLRDRAMIAEPWDPGPGGYRLGAFPAGWGEWNDRFRDAVRLFWRGDGATVGELATRLAGSADVFAPPRPVARSVNFITAHDGFTLFDLVAYTQKRNEANGEGNRDGTDRNLSWNHGVEGATEDPRVVAARAGDARALLATLLTARGTPMLSMGDEAGRSQGGNNNAYAQDNALAWFDWDRLDAARVAFTARLIALRRSHPALRGTVALTGAAVDASGVPDVAWHAGDGSPMTPGRWQDPANRTLAAAFYAPATATEPADRVLLALHAGNEPTALVPPPPRTGFAWRLLVDSAEPAAPERLVEGPLGLAPRSVVLLGEVPSQRPARPDDGSARARLAEAAGIAPGWWDLEGRWHATGEDTGRALLAAMGLPAASAAEVAESLSGLAEAGAPPLPPALVVRLGERAELRLGPALAHGAVRLTITAETGERRTLDVGADDGVAEALAGPDGRVRGFRRVALPPLAAGRYQIEADRDEADRDGAACGLVVAPPRCHLPAGGRAFGVAAQLYALRRGAGDQGIGDLTGLAELAAGVARAGGAVVGINPLHMLFPQDRTRASPYQPSDRRFLDPLAIDVTAPPLPMEADGVRAALAEAAGVFQALSGGRFVDYPAVWAAKARVLEAAFAAFRGGAEFDRFVAVGGPALRDFARFQAIAGTTAGADWRAWPAALRDPANPAVNRAAPPDRVRFAEFLQFVADRQLAAAAAAGKDMAVGLYRDLAVGAAPDGAEAWAAGKALLGGVSVGAPPDPFSPLGQVWGVPPPDPLLLRAEGYAGFAGLLRANMRHAGALRIDHVMGLARLFVVPDGARGADGTYLSYPMADLMGVVALESARARCLVVGEDLGTVPEGIRTALADHAMLSYQVLRFARDADGLRPPGRWPALAAACAATHDLATLAGWWHGADIEERAALGLLDPEAALAERRTRERDKAELVAVLRAAGIDPGPGLVHAVHELLARTPCRLVLLQADDLAGETMAANLPGTDRERPNWRRRLRADVAAVVAELYQRPYELTALAQSREAMERMVCGAATSAFQASQQASTIAV
jgi:glycogen operon protein